VKQVRCFAERDLHPGTGSGSLMTQSAIGEPTDRSRSAPILFLYVVGRNVELWSRVLAMVVPDEIFVGIE
jgi:hypothetical protein